uniref:Si:dkey-190g11.3 n=1 Tax=Oryzias latipes TaxID=8090 RepID=A0A3P9HM15_ORYLA
MEDSIDQILQDHSSIFPTNRPHPIVSACTGALLTGVYGVWSLFAMPGFRKIPWKLKVPYLPSCKDQTRNVMTLLEGRRGRLADLGSGDGRLVSDMSKFYVSVEVPASQAVFLKKDFWKTDLSSFNNVTAFLAPGVMQVLGEKLLTELPDDARVIACRFPFPNWPQKMSMGSGLNEVFAYDMRAVRVFLKSSPSTACK